MLTWPQNARNPISDDLSFKNFPGEDVPGTSYSIPYLEPPSLTSHIHPSIWSFNCIKNLFLINHPLHATETGISFGLMGHLARMQTLLSYF